MGNPKYNQRGFRYRPSGGTFVDSGAGVVQTVGQDSKNDQVRIWGRIGDTGVPGLGEVVGKGFTAVRTGVGDWLVTFDQGFTALQSANAEVAALASGAPVDQVGQVSTFVAGVAGACTLRILNFTGAAAVDLAAGDYMCFEAVLCSQWLD